PLLIFFSIPPPPPASPLFPYTTLFRSRRIAARDGHTGARRKGDIGFASLRGGSVVGDHSVIFAAAGERIELVHRAEDRGIYARRDRKSTRLNSSHVSISYAVFCLKKKK